jgi:hypothetical protein
VRLDVPVFTLKCVEPELETPEVRKWFDEVTVILAKQLESNPFGFCVYCGSVVHFVPS